MSRTLTIAAAAAFVLTSGAFTAAADPVPGPKTPIAHLAVPGPSFQVLKGTNACNRGPAVIATSFPVPRGAVVTGATVYFDNAPGDGGISAKLDRYDLTTGDTDQLARLSSDQPGPAVLDLVVPGGAVMNAGSAPQVAVALGPGVCVKGAEIHFRP